MGNSAESQPVIAGLNLDLESLSPIDLNVLIGRAHAISRKRSDQERLESSKKLIGRCFKYRNRYSAGESWWLYSMVTGVTEYADPSGIWFEHTSDGQRHLHMQQLSQSSLQTEISIKEWQSALTEFLKDFGKTDPVVAAAMLTVNNN